MKSKLIEKIISELNNQAILQNKPKPSADTLFSLAFKTESELNAIAITLGVK